MANSYVTLLAKLPAIVVGRLRSGSRGRSAELDHLADGQLADIGMHRDEQGQHRRVREPALLDVLFPRMGGASSGGQHEMNPLRPRHGPTRRRETVK